MANQHHIAAVAQSPSGTATNSISALSNPTSAADWDLTGHDFSHSATTSFGLANVELTGHVDFSGCTLPKNFRLCNVLFRGPISFKGALFLGDVEFDNVHASRIDFTSATFLGFVHLKDIRTRHLRFDAAKFSDGMRVVSAMQNSPIDTEYCSDGAQYGNRLRLLGTFSRIRIENSALAGGLDLFDLSVKWELTIRSCEIKHNLFCDEARGLGKLTIAQSVCHGAVDFHDVNIGDLCLDGSTFCAPVSFRTAIEPRARIGRISCDAAFFWQALDFENRHVSGATNLRGARFHIPPRFHGATLHQETDFKGADFSAGVGHPSAEHAFRTLKLAMSQHQSHEEELLFFGLEMQARALHEPSKAVRAVYALYGLTSNYGHSVRRPLKFLVYLFAFSLVATAAIVELPAVVDCARGASRCIWSSERASKIAALVAAQSIPFAPALKEAAADARKELLDQPSVWQSSAFLALATVQASISVMLLFLVGLGLRNRFRLR